MQFMNMIAAIASAVVLACALSSSARAQSAPAKLDIVSADWSPKQAQSLNALPKSAVWNFVSGPFRGSLGHVCDYRFADLRHSGNLSLIVVIDTGATAGCEGAEIFDKTASGFEHYSTVAEANNLRDSIQDINHDGNLKLVLYGTLADSESQYFGCTPEWPLIFGWTGNGYTDVSSEHKGYYKRYLNSLDKQIAASSGSEQPQPRGASQTSAPQPAMIQVPMVATVQGDASNGHGFGRFVPTP
jgi:hypothetical protein